MSLPMLFNSGAECGPSNPLQGLSKRFDQDRGIQQDHIGAPRTASSRAAFRTQTGPIGPDADAGRFFNLTPTPTVGASRLSTAFDVSAMRTALPSASVQLPQSQAPASLVTGWAADFMRMDLGDAQQSKQQIQHIPSPVGSMQARSIDAHPGVVHSPTPPLLQNWNTMGPGMHPFIPHTPIRQEAQASTPVLNDQLSWDKEFSAQEVQVASMIAEQQTQKESETINKPQFEGDDLSRTAGMLVENLKHETNPKFQNSQFMSLMKQLRDGEVVVSGNQVIVNDGTKNSSQLDKGKGRALDNLSSVEDRTMTNLPVFQVQHQHDLPSQMKEGGDLGKEDANDAYFRQENAEYTKFWQEAEQLPASTLTMNSQEREWDSLQEDWDRFEATSSGIKQIDHYQFQDNNPYLLGDSSRTRHHALHTEISPLLKSVLELEAIVQQDMTKARAWYELGIKQQENEREHKALQALKHAIELDPSHLPSWLALSISYANDNNRRSTYDAVEEWLKRNERYVTVPYDATDTAHLPVNERCTKLIDQLMVMVRSDSSGEIDADTQIALAILLNTKEDYQKAQDCFRMALAIRPEDWLLYNRVGATVANSGHPEEALQYYYKALELNPGYIRARFNLGISCINLRRYEEAAQYILDALVLQDNDGVKETAMTSTALWNSLKTACLHMQRADLASLCDIRDLEQFRVHFDEGG